MSPAPVRVSVAIFPECDPSVVYGVFDTLWAAGRLWNSTLGLPRGEPLFTPRLVSADPGPMRLVTGVSVIPQDAIAEVTETDVVFVPNVLVDTPESVRALDRRMLAWIGRMYRGGAQVYAVCGGTLALAEAGLLESREATTHWGYAPLFRQLYPDITLHTERILVQSGPGHRIVCAGGASSWQDLALLLIAKHGGTEEAIRMSKLFLYQWHRDGQLPFASMIRNVNHGDGLIRECQTWVAEHYERADAVAQMVRRSGLPKRTFDRRFKAATGYSPLAYVQALRIEEAKQMLETGSAPVDAIGREVGYADAAAFRRLFRRLAGMTPGDYRRTFQVPRFDAPASGRRVSRLRGRAGGADRPSEHRSPGARLAARRVPPGRRMQDDRPS